MKPSNRNAAPPEILAGLEPPPPPTELKGEALAAARLAWTKEPGSDLWTRLWYHRGLRAAWVGAAALLLAGHILVPSGISDREAVTADLRPDAEMTEFLRPMRIVVSATPNLGRNFPEEHEISTLTIGGNGG